VDVDPLLAPVLAAALALVGVLAGVYATYRASNRKLKSDGPHQMIDQLQEDVRELRAERAATAARVSALESTKRRQEDYIAALRRHIADHQPPPPPAWPDGL
jgi:cell division protein FtsB